MNESQTATLKSMLPDEFVITKETNLGLEFLVKATKKGYEFSTDPKQAKQFPTWQKANKFIKGYERSNRDMDGNKIRTGWKYSTVEFLVENC